MEQRRRRAILAVKWGPLGGRRRLLEPGQPLRVGRGELADMVVPHDAQMSALHFEAIFDGVRCRIKDLGSARGTLINGEEGRTEGEVEHGGWVKAGDTVLTIHFEGATPARLPEEDRDDEEHDPDAQDERSISSARDAIDSARDAAALHSMNALTTLRERLARGPLYAVVDAARDRRILELLRESVDMHQSLYEGVQGDALEHVAPYLVRFSEESRLLEMLLWEGWGRRWGIYLTSTQPLKELRRHLRRFLMVNDEETGGRLYFRFYDPAVLRAFLPVCTAQQQADLLSHVSCFTYEGPQRQLLDYPDAPLRSS